MVRMTVCSESVIGNHADRTKLADFGHDLFDGLVEWCGAEPSVAASTAVVVAEQTWLTGTKDIGLYALGSGVMSSDPCRVGD